jgi:AcrR family transcriptional regulator
LVRKAASPRRARAQRGDILERAVELMEVKGFAGMSARELANELAFSKANFFYHVSSKEELLYQIFVETLESFTRRVEEIIAGPDPAETKLRRLIDFYVRHMFERGSVMVVWFKERGHLNREHAAHVRELETRLLAMTSEFYETAIAEGAFRPVTPLIARMTMFGMCFMLTRLPREQDEDSIREMSEQVQQIACGGLLAPPRARA